MADAEDEIEVQSTIPSTEVEDKPQPERKVIASMVQGTVKWFNVRNGYGFINRNDTKEDVFVHQTAVIKNNPRKFLRSVGDGEIVEFDVIEAPKGTEAANVTGPGGVPVKGSCYAPNKRRFRRRIFPRSPRPGKPADGQAPTSEGEGAVENDGAMPAQRRRRPRRPRQEGEAVEQKGEVAEDKQQRVPRRRFRPLRNRPFAPRPPSEQQGDGQPPETVAATQPPAGQPDASQPDAPTPQQTGELAEGQAQRPRRQFSRRRQRVSQSSGSKNGTEKSALENGTPPPTSTPADLRSTSKSPKSSPKSSPKTSKAQESPPKTTPPPTE